MSSSYTDRTAAAVEHCEAMASRNPAMAESYTEMATFLQEKLWHQLSLVLLKVLSTRDESSAAAAAELYDKVVLVVDSKLHPLATARMAVLTAHQLHGAGDSAAAKAVMENCLERLKHTSVEATIYLQSKHALLILSELVPTLPVQAGGGLSGATLATIPAETSAALQQILVVIQANAPIIQEMSSTGGGAVQTSTDAAHNLVHAAHYEAVMTYYKVVGPAAAFYEHAMQYLQYAGPVVATDTDVSVASSCLGTLALAVDLALAALTGVGIYNLTAITEQTAVLAPLQAHAEYNWLWQVLHAVAAGDVVQCRALSAQHQAVMATVPALVQHGTVVDEKLTLTALVTAVGRLHAHERNLALTDIQAMIHLDDANFHQVELVLMRAFAVGLLKGQIDQCAGTVDITWVQPRRLTAAQMTDLASKFGSWAVKVHQTAESVQQQTSKTLLA